MDLTVIPKQARTVNAVLASLGVIERLVRGNGYWYFDKGNSSAWYTSSVAVYRITSGSIEWWLQQWLYLAADGEDLKVVHTGVDYIFTDVFGKMQVTVHSVTDAVRWLVAYHNALKGAK